MIISASRRTDIPAFYSEWFLNRLKEGFLYVRNPFNADQISKINLSPLFIECIVFWTKNSANIMNYLRQIDELGYKYYFQFTLTSYDTSIEEYVPSKKKLIKIFQKLSDTIGPDQVIWRYDPILITDKFTIEYHIKWYEYIAKNIENYTSKCIISFIDMYKKCERNLRGINIENIDLAKKKILAKKLSQIAGAYNFVLESCAEEIELAEEGIQHGKCIDDKLISRLLGKQLSAKKDKNQRQECGCVTSIDIGAYNTCRHGCKYCYANFSRKTVEKNRSIHDKTSPLITGKIAGNEKITERKMPLLFKARQQSLF